MKNKILLLCLNNSYARDVALELCEITGNFYLNCEEMLEYELADRETILKKCGLEYLKKQEKKFVKGLLDYDNVVMSMSFDLYTTNNNFLVLDDTFFKIYLFINKTNLEKDLAMDSLNILAFEERDLLLNQHADKVINCDKKRINQIIGQITKK